MTDWLGYAIPLVARFEGVARRGRDGLIYPYQDAVGVWTIGYGWTVGVNETTPPITMAQARVQLRSGLVEYVERAARFAPRLMSLPPLALAAVASWCWNCGTGRFRSRLARPIQDARYAAVASALLTPRTARGVLLLGLVRRRDEEARLFRAGMEIA